VTLYFSRGTPNLVSIIPAMDVINKSLNTLFDSPQKYSVAIRAVLTIRKRTLSKYYNKTGESEVYHIAMSMFLLFYVHHMFLIAIIVLHPCHKLEYFRKNNWDEPSIEATRDIVQDKFNKSYHKLDIEGGNGTSPTDANVVVSHSDSFSF